MMNNKLELQFYQRAWKIFQYNNIMGQVVRSDNIFYQYKCIDKNLSYEYPYIYGLCKLADLTYKAGVFSETMHRKICNHIMEAVETAYKHVDITGRENRTFFPNNNFRLAFINLKIAQLSRER